MTFYSDRQAIAPLLRTHSPEDALTAYYALHHSEIRTRLVVHRDPQERPDGFIAVCQTGFDLFQPLVVLRAWRSEVAAELLHTGLSPLRSYHIVVPPALAPVIEAEMNIQTAETHYVFEVRPAAFKPVINVLVTSSRGPDGQPRFTVRSAAGPVVAESGTNWRSDEFAEVFVQVEPAARGRGLGRSVASGTTSHVLQTGLRPLYIVDQDNDESIAIATGLGYADTGAREWATVASPKP